MSDPFPVVICVDDEPAILSALQRELRREPYEFLTTEKPEEAVTWVLEKKASILIADQRMPGISGLEILEMVMTCSPETSRVLLSGQTDLTGILRRTRIQAIQKLVRKPWDADDLRSMLRSLLPRRH
jgi:DNA-binding NtrC family response regulator